MRIIWPRDEQQARWSPGAARRRPVVEAVKPLPRASANADGPKVQALVCKTKLVHNGVSLFAGQAVWLTPGEFQAMARAKQVWVYEADRTDWWTSEGRILAAEPCDAQPLVTAPREGSLKIFTSCGYDPGNAVYRMHTALNEHTQHASVFVPWRERDGNPFRCPQQLDGETTDAKVLRSYAYEADVLYANVDYFHRNAGLGNRPRTGQLIVRHYHGSLQSGPETQYSIRDAWLDDSLHTLLFGARLTICALRPERIQWMPIPMPVDRYAAMVPAERETKVLRVAHSATNDSYKGTQDLIDIVDALKAKGLPIELVLIGYRRKGRKLEPKRRTHAEALAIKAGCHVTVDSVHWLGLQGSGLEGAAMGQAVLAGDPDVAALYQNELGSVPYTHIEGADPVQRRRSLKELLARLATDREFLASEADRAGRYVREVHDYPVVARRFEQAVSKALGRPEVLT